jgi:hypothetical protein
MKNIEEDRLHRPSIFLPLLSTDPLADEEDFMERCVVLGFDYTSFND